MIEILSRRLQQEISDVTLFDDLRQQSRRDIHAEVKDNVMKMLLAVFDQRSDTGGILGYIRNLNSKRRRPTGSHFDLRRQTKFPVEARINRAPITERQVAFT